MAWLAAAAKPELARQARAALAVDTLDMTFDADSARRAFADLPNTDVALALRKLLADPGTERFVRLPFTPPV